MIRKLTITVALSAAFLANNSLAGACSSTGGSLTQAQDTLARTVMSNLIHPDDENTIKYIKECYTLPLSNCQMAVDTSFHQSPSDPTPHMTWRIGKANEGIYTSPVRTMHIFAVQGNRYGFTAFETGAPNKDTPCNHE